MGCQNDILAKDKWNTVPNSMHHCKSLDALVQHLAFKTDGNTLKICMPPSKCFDKALTWKEHLIEALDSAKAWHP